MARTLLLLLILAWGSIGFAQSKTLSCTSDLSTRVACFIEQTVWTFATLEVAVGVDTLASSDSHVTPYVTVAYYGASTAIVFEAALPPVYPLLGRDTPFRVSFTTRW